MKKFQQRNPIGIALSGVAVIAAGMLAAVNADDLPVIGAGTIYKAEFKEAAGIKSGNEVRAAGIKVGKVNDVELNDQGVLVTFYVKDAWMGDQTRADIKLKSLLGTKFLSVDPAGTKPLDPDTTIPLNHTTSPYDVLEAFRGLADTVGKIDTKQLAKAFDTISNTLHGTPNDMTGALKGLSRLSDTIAKRDNQLARLLANTKDFSQTLSDRDAQLVDLMKNGNVLLDALIKRKKAITDLFAGTKELTQQLNGLVVDNSKQLKPVLADLDKVTTMLHNNEKGLNDTIRAAAPFARQGTNMLGNGHWWDIYLCGLLLPDAAGVNDKGCDPR